MMASTLNIVLYLSLAIHTVLGAVCLWRVIRGDNVIDSLAGLELVSIVLMATLILVSMITQNSLYVDVAVGLAAIGFISTIAMARHMADEQMF